MTKLRKADGAVLGSYPVGSIPIGITFDGNNMWVTSLGNDDVTKIRATDGAVVGHFAVGRDPYYCAFDGSNIWVSNGLDRTVTKLRAALEYLGDRLSTHPASRYKPPGRPLLEEWLASRRGAADFYTRSETAALVDAVAVVQ